MARRLIGEASQSELTPDGFAVHTTVRNSPNRPNGTMPNLPDTGDVVLAGSSPAMTTLWKPPVCQSFSGLV